MQKTQTRPATTAAAPSTMQAPPAPAPHPGAAATGSSGPGLFGQMAATAGSVAMGSVVGHGLSSMLFGGSRSAEAVEQPAAQSAPQQQQAMSCDFQAKRDFFYLIIVYDGTHSIFLYRADNMFGKW